MRVVVKLKEYLWRPLTDSDADTAFALDLRNTERFRKMFYSGEVTPEMHRKFVERGHERGEINWLVERAGEQVGVAAIYNIDRANRKAELGRIVSLDPRMFHLTSVVWGVVGMDLLGLNKAYMETLECN